jgi:type IX secretion system PorP/SprF family membrane protein
MKLTLLLVFSTIFIFCSVRSKAQQDVHFSQFYELPLLRNPALAGIFNGNVRFTAAYRNQWESITVPYRTMAISSEIKIFKGFTAGDFITAGFQATHDVAGDSKLKRTQFLPVLNYHKLLNEEYNTLLSVAFMGGAVTEGFDPGKLKFDDQFVNGAYSSSNPTSQPFTTTSFNYFDFSAGLSLTSAIGNSARIYLGAGLFHITEPSLSFMLDNEIKLNKKLVFNAGFSVYTNESDRIFIYGDYFMQGGDRMMQAGFLYTHNFDLTGDYSRLSFSGGAAYRWKDALIPIIKLNTNNLSVGLSYDINTSNLKTASNYRGGFELIFSYMDLWSFINKGAEKVNCPTNIW